MHSLAYHEHKQHGTHEFPVAYYYVDESHPQYNMPFHWHKEWEIIRIIRGSFLLYADEEAYEAHPGDILLLRDGMLHGGTPSSCVYECLVFDLHGLFRDIAAVKKYLRPLYRNQLLPQVFYPAGTASGTASDTAAVTAVVAELMSAFHGTACELLVLGSLSRLFSILLRQSLCVTAQDGADSGSHRITRLKPVLEYIENHYAAPLTLSDLASCAGMSPKYFCRFFHSITHQTPMEYVNYYRVEQAANLLGSTDMTITAVGMECGFNDGSYFVKAFKKHKGLTPRQYRKGDGQ